MDIAGVSRFVTNSCAWKRSLAVAWIAAVAVGIVLFTPALYGQGSPGQVTTYAALTASNTSAGAGANAQSGATTPSVNVSKVLMTSVLPANSSTKVYARLMGWFGTSTHQDVGYSSTDPTQVQKQVADMLSRGISGAIINWQGISDVTDQAAQLMMADAEKQNGNFQFAIEDDAGNLAQCAATSGCDLVAKEVSDLTYIQHTYTGAAPYLMFQGNPVIFLYGMEAYTLDWNQIRASLPGNPVLVFRSAVASAALNKLKR